LKKAITDLDIKPGEEQLFDLTPYLPALKPNADYHINLRFTFKDSTVWANKHFIIAENQFEIQKAIIKKSATKGEGIIMRNGLDGVEVNNKIFRLKVGSNGKGGLSELYINDKKLIFQPLLPHFTRPLTDNDKRGWKPQRKLKQWYESELKLISTIPSEDENGIAVTNLYNLINDSATVKIVYHINLNGVIKVDFNLSVKQSLPNIPKVGMQMAIERSYDNISWFGRGPFENYIDKNYAADVGLYNLPITDFMENYVVPQENGNRTDVRWMFLNNPKTKDGLLIAADSLLSMSAWPYTEENIQNARHTNKLKDAGFITLNIDLIQMGVGGNDSWSEVAAPLEKYQIPAKDYNYSFYIVPFNAKNKLPGERAKEIKN
jgi:beta-galactosidase